MLSHYLLWLALAAGLQGLSQQSIVVVVGARGADEYGPEFASWTREWEQAALRAPARLRLVGVETAASGSDRDELARQLKEEIALPAEALWIVFIGHGTFDGETAKFNLRGPDMSAEELQEWLQDCARPVIVVNCTSSSAPFLNQLAGAQRIVVTATKNGYQYNFARFGRFFAEAIGDSTADLDKDEQTSLLEAFLLASARVEEFYSSAGRLATEHALIDDNGDGRGTPATWFRGVRVTRESAEGEPDGLRANQVSLIRSRAEQRLTAEDRQHRDELELQIEQLRQRKSQLDEDAYYEQLEQLLVPLARIYARS